MRLVIHIGFRKTGTTFLQNEFFVKLPVDKFNYLGKKNNTDGYPEWLINWQYLTDFEFEKNIESLRDSIFELLSEDRINMISSEAFTNTDMWYRSSQRILKLFPDAEILITIRDKEEMLRSLYRHKVAEGSFTRKLRDYLDYSTRPFDIHKRKPIFLADYDFDKIIDHYKKNFKKVFVLCLQDFFAKSTVLQEFYGDLGIEHFEFNSQLRHNSTTELDLEELLRRNILNEISLLNSLLEEIERNGTSDFIQYD